MRSGSGKWDVIVAYRVRGVAKSVQLSRSLHGYKDRSNRGRYLYDREGLLERIPHLQLQKGVLLLREGDVEPVVRLLEKYGAEYYVARIETSGKPKTPAQSPPQQETK